MNKDVLFLRTLDDLDGRLQPGQAEYDIIRMSGLLRQLLVDGNNLVDQVNRTRRIKISYKAYSFHAPIEPDVVFWALGDWLTPNTPAGSAAGYLTLTEGVRQPSPPEGTPDTMTPQDLAKDRFLALQVVLYHGHVFTVKEIILYLANAAGGVHAGEPKDDKEQALALLLDPPGDIPPNARAGQHSAVIYTLLAIGRGVRRGLDPLRARISADLSGPP